jgi:hypothetical protein
VIAAVTPMLEIQRSTVSPDDNLVNSTVKIQPESSVDAITKSTAEAHESPIAKSASSSPADRGENTNQIAAPQPTDTTAKSSPLRKNIPKEIVDE